MLAVGGLTLMLIGLMIGRTNKRDKRLYTS